MIEIFLRQGRIFCSLEMQKQILNCAPDTLCDVAPQDNVAFLEQCVPVPRLK